METITLLILPIVFGSTVMGSGSILDSLKDTYTNYVSFRNEGWILDPELKTLLDGMKFGQLELLNQVEDDTKYPYCRYYKEIQFFLDPNETPQVRVRVQKKYWSANPDEGSSTFDANSSVDIWHNVIEGKVSFYVDMNQYPRTGRPFGFDLIEHVSEERKKKHQTEIKHIKYRMQNEMSIAMIYVAPDRSYAIFRTWNHKCAWIGWSNEEARGRGLTYKIRKLLKANNIRFRPGHWVPDEDSEDED